MAKKHITASKKPHQRIEIHQHRQDLQVGKVHKAVSRYEIIDKRKGRSNYTTISTLEVYAEIPGNLDYVEFSRYHLSKDDLFIGVFLDKSVNGGKSKSRSFLCLVGSPAKKITKRLEEVLYVITTGIALGLANPEDLELTSPKHSFEIKYFPENS